MQHQHGPNCGCKDILGIQTASDLLGSIDIDRVRTLNEQNNRTGQALFREHDLRFQKQNFIASDSDGELLLIVPFLAQVKIRSICVIGLDFETAPLEMRLYVNNQNVDFSLSESPAVQEFALSANLQGLQQNAVNPNKFSRVHKLVMHLRRAGTERIGVAYVQIKGENSNIKRQAVQAVYELKPTAQRNDLKDLSKNAFQMG